MDHKRGHGSLDHANEQFTRVKRHKDYSYQQPTNSSHFPQNKGRSNIRLQSGETRKKDTRNWNVQTRNSIKVELTSVEQLRAIAEKSAKSVNHLRRPTYSKDASGAAEKTVEESAYEEYLPLIFAELDTEKLAAGFKWPFCLENKRTEKHCAVCSFDRRFRGWEALLIHAAKFQKEKTHQHRGYYRALREALLQSTNEQLPLPNICEGPTSPLPKKRASNDRCAPPVIFVDENVDNDGTRDKNDNFVSPHQTIAASHRAKDLPIRPSRNPHLEEGLAVCNDGCNHKKEKIVVISASEVGCTERGLLETASRKETESLDHDATSKLMKSSESEAPKFKKHGGDEVGTTQDNYDVILSTSKSLCMSSHDQTMQLGRPSSPKDRHRRHLANAHQEKLEWEELKLQKPLEEHRYIFDEQQFDDKVQSLICKWKGGFRGLTVHKEDHLPLELCDGERTLRKSRKFQKSELERHERFKEDVEKYALLNPSSRKQVRRQIAVLQDELKKDKLMWLQEVEAVREQFQALANLVHDEQVERDGTKVRITKHLDKISEITKAKMYDKKNFFLTRKLECMQSMRRIRREQDSQVLMDLWREEQRTFEKECRNAKKEKQKLIQLHERIHTKAKESKMRRECPICLEKWDLDT